MTVIALGLVVALALQGTAMLRMLGRLDRLERRLDMQTETDDLQQIQLDTHAEMMSALRIGQARVTRTRRTPVIPIRPDPDAG